MRISIDGVDIEVMWSVNPDASSSHFYLISRGPSESTTRDALASVVDMLTRHRKVLWRMRQTPCEFSRDFMTMTEWWQSLARFSVVGETVHHDPQNVTEGGAEMTYAHPMAVTADRPDPTPDQAI
jgi:hypothetical protein